MLYKLSRTYPYSILILISAAGATAIALQIFALTGHFTWLEPTDNWLSPTFFLPAALALALAEDRSVKEIADSPWWLRAIAIASGVYILAVVLVIALGRSTEFLAFDESIRRNRKHFDD